eukprot:scaffold440_cov277-Ochromonas_danica.AAC.10
MNNTNVLTSGDVEYEVFTKGETHTTTKKTKKKKEKERTNTKEEEEDTKSYSSLSKQRNP